MSFNYMKFKNTSGSFICLEIYNKCFNRYKIYLMNIKIADIL